MFELHIGRRFGTNYFIIPCKISFLRCSKRHFRNVRVISPTNYTSGTVATVFGCTGFLGTYIVQRLAQLGIQIVAPYRGDEKSINRLKPMGDVGQIVPIFFSIRNEASIARAITHSNVVINLLSKRYETSNFSFEDVNVDAAKRIAEISNKSGVQKLIHVSALGADENSSSKWARSKAIGEKEVLKTFPNATILRPAPVIGFEDQLVNNCGQITKLLSTMLLVVNPSARIQPLHLEDFLNSVEAVLSMNVAPGKTYHLGGPKVYRMEDFIREVIYPGLLIHQNRMIVSLSPRIGRLLATLVERVQSLAGREPLYFADEVDLLRKSDLVVPRGSPSMKELSVDPLPIEAYAANILRIYVDPKKLQF
jgi:NADH dehydrogenase (ubiquinone) 1 alpha subcomplex subunit 9